MLLGRELICHVNRYTKCKVLRMLGSPISSVVVPRTRSRTTVYSDAESEDDENFESVYGVAG